MSAFLFKRGLAVLAMGAMAIASALVLALRAEPSAHGNGLPLTLAEVSRIDAEHSRLILRHEPIENLGLPRMRMEFRATPAQLQTVKLGDSVRFRADNRDGLLVITELRPSQR